MCLLKHLFHLSLLALFVSLTHQSASIQLTKNFGDHRYQTDLDRKPFIHSRPTQIVQPTNNFGQSILHNFFLTDRQDIFNGADPIQVTILSALGFLMYLFAATAVGAVLAREDTSMEAKITILSNTNANGINGEVIFSQEDVNSPLRVSGTLKNLPPGLHGFHVHEKRHTGNDCSTAGGHFDPSNTEHGSRISNVRHAGDFGNIEANANGEANIDFSIETGRYLSTLFGENSLVDKSLVIHELEDVFTQPTGAAGSRLACGVLEKS